MKTIKEIYWKMLKAYTRGKQNKAAKLEYKMLKRELEKKNG